MKTVSIIGMGRVGCALERELSAAFFIEARFGRTPDLVNSINAIDEAESLDSDIIIISTNDDSVASVAGSIANKLRGDQVILHTSGSLSSAVLEGLRKTGSSTGSMHPLVSVSEAKKSKGIFNGAYFCIEGDEAAVEAASAVAIDLGGKPFTIPTEKKSLYHAAAVMAAGHLTALIDMAAEMMTQAGVNKEISLKILQPLVASVTTNIFLHGPESALTGTYERGDVDTAKAHLKALADNDDDELSKVFRGLAKRSLQLTRLNGTNPSRVNEIAHLLDLGKPHREL